MPEIDTKPRWPLMRLEEGFLSPKELSASIPLNDGEMIMLRAGLIHLSANLPDTPLRRAIRGILEKLERALEMEFGVGRFAPLIDKEV